MIFAACGHLAILTCSSYKLVLDGTQNTVGKAVDLGHMKLHSLPYCLAKKSTYLQTSKSSADTGKRKGLGMNELKG